jgi:hypothetical protein
MFPVKWSSETEQAALECVHARHEAFVWLSGLPSVSRDAIIQQNGGQGSRVS